MRIPVVNEEDEIIGYKDRKDRNPKDIFRATCLWVADKEGNILLAQRALKKEHAPGLWSLAVGGTVEEGETYESNIIKEAKEEIGLVGLSFKLISKIRFFDCFTQLYSTVVDRDYPFLKQDEEVENIKWFSQKELEELLLTKREMFTVNFPYYYKKILKQNEN